ncbi:adenylate/guanylate cyclase domain-containing protein [Magnetospirillum sulfuroxidans]|uniref:HAMP domain-containing protein n=1 Tax=Magnetospirillum sulfuroxidans TaxID=611300 RepID=A0ABS5ICN6_9PROT|nr:adenylate/guanylate cyclase domain-containing protein [Magnetospirillum sulfuroxidans]MBR9972187.1 HAMP domain-containing protein [Magnetospirillum sulfuroxidans]
MDRVRIRLRLGITVMFLLIVVPLSSAMIGFIYSRNATLARQMAEQSMDLAAREVTIKVSGVIDGMARALDMAVAFGKGQQNELRRPESLRPMLEQLQQMPGVFSLYFGMHEDGAFYQVAHPEADDSFISPNGNKAPKDAKWAIRIIDNSSGQWRDTVLYLAKWAKVVGLERARPAYDPRQRPWYKAALTSDDIAGSPVYMFAGSTQPGLTLSRRLTTSDGARLAVFGADMTIAALSAFLREQKVGQAGRVFILDGDGRMIGYPDEHRIIKADGAALRVIDAAEIDDPVVAQAVKGLRAGNGQHFAVRSAADDSDWLVSFTPFANRFGSTWTIGVVVAEDEFTGPIKRASLMILVAGGLFLTLAALAILWASRMLVRPLEALIRETDSIRRLELDTPVRVLSPVIEIDSLASAIASMKTGLASFGTYVPKSLVHDIIRSGAGTLVGGQRRPLTVMFTDLQGFTAATESMPPEQVLPWLSSYFDAMSSAIHLHHGTIDKYIGDAIMALWNAPLDDDHHVANACRAMLACREAAIMSSGDTALKTRMGLHTGTAVVGNVGASDRMQYTALGAMVNLAARVEGLNKQLDTQLLITGAVAQAVAGRFTLRPMGKVLAVGTSQPIEVHELLGEGSLAAADVQIWGQAMDLIGQRRWTEAAAAFRAFSALRPHDKAAALYLKALQTAEADHWDGVLRFVSK